MKKYVVHQNGIKDCGAACLLSIIRYYDGDISIEKLRDMTNTTKEGVSAFDLVETARMLGFYSRGVKMEEDNINTINLPAIAHVTIDNSYNHYVVIYKITKRNITIMNPEGGMKTLSLDYFFRIWNKVLILIYPEKKIPKINNDVSLFDFLINLIKPYKKTILNIVGLSFLFTIFNIINSFYLKYIIDYLSINAISNFYIISLIFGIIVIVKTITDYFRNELLLFINKKIDISLIKTTYNHIIHLPYNYFKNRTTGEIISRIGDLSNVRDMISKLSLTICVDSILVIFTFFILYFLNSTLFFISLILVVGYIIIIAIYNKLIGKKVIDTLKSDAVVTSYLVESINAFETIKGLNIEDEVSRKLEGKYTKLTNKVFNLSRLYNSEGFLKNLITYIGCFIIIFIGGILIEKGEMTIGTLVTFNALFVYFIEPIRNIIDLEYILRTSLASLRRIKEIFEVEIEDVCDNKKSINKNLNGLIKCNNLVFSHRRDVKVLENINLEIKNKEKIILLGESGSGKSTLAKILMKYHSIKRGYLTIDDVDINDYSLKDIRSKICYVSQQELLFTDTLLNNISLDRDIKYEEILNMSNLVYVKEIIKDNPLGFNMLIEENGFNISGGERQRIILARALLKNFDILILDEALNQIDIELERKILKNIFKLFNNKTIIVISHRNENIDLFDKKFRLNSKKIEVI